VKTAAFHAQQRSFPDYRFSSKAPVVLRSPAV